MYLANVDSVYDLAWAPGVTYGRVHHQSEVEFSRFNFDIADTVVHTRLFEAYEAEAQRLLRHELILPAYEYCLKCSHLFNLLDARGAISVTERTAYLGRLRAMTRRVAEGIFASARSSPSRPFESARHESRPAVRGRDRGTAAVGAARGAARAGRGAARLLGRRACPMDRYASTPLRGVSPSR